MISVHALTFSFPHGEPVLQDLSFTLEPGSITCLAGLNGSGKSTLLGILAGLFTPTSGTVTVAGHTSPGQEQALRGAARLVLQEAELQCLGATVGEDLLLGMGHAEPIPYEASARTMAARMGLEAHWDTPIHTLSHGQKRKCAIAGALLASPQVLLLDEPTSGLDHPALLELRQIIQENHAAGMTQVIATHDLEPILDLCQAVVALRDGALICSTSPEAAMPHMAALGMRPPCSWRTSGRLQPYA